MPDRLGHRDRLGLVFVLVTQVLALALAFGIVEPVARTVAAVEFAPAPSIVTSSMQLPASSATDTRLQAQLEQAEAILAEAQLRVQQAQAGEGGLGARPEDITAAQAELVAAKVALRLRQPFDDVRFLQGPILLFEGTTAAATSIRDGCGDAEATTRIYLEDQEVETKLHIALNCPDQLRGALDASIDVQRALLTSAQLKLKQFTKPDPQIQNFVAPFEQEVKKSEHKLQKLKTGGFRDQATLELNVVRAQADVDALKAALAGSIAGMLQAQRTRAGAELKDALYRVEQAKTGQGGVDVRAEDIASAEADVAIAKANLGLFLDPIAEEVGQSRAMAEGAAAAERFAQKTLDACGKGKVTVRLKENDDGEITFMQFVREMLRARAEELGPRERARQRPDGSLADRLPLEFEIGLPGLPPILIDFLRRKVLERLRDRIEERLAELGARIEEIRGRIIRTRELAAATKEILEDVELELNDQCTGDYRRELEAAVDEAAALKVIAEQKLKLLTNPSPQQIAHYVIPLQQAVVVAEARLRKLKTGGLQDQATLERNVARARADVDGLDAMLAGSLNGLYRAQLAGAQAEFVEATYRIEQARTGSGGIGARPEDIAIAQAELIAAEQSLQIITDPLPELIAAGHAGVDAAKAAVRGAQHRRAACDRLVRIGTVRLDQDNDDDDGDDRELPEKTYTSQECSRDLKDSLDHAVSQAKANQRIAELTLKKLTNPSEKLIAYLTGPPIQAITIAQARLQKLKTGGLLDESALELRRARAQAEGAFWQAAIDGAQPRQIQAQIQVAQAELKEALFRQIQAQTGQGGADARPEDITMAEALAAIETIKLAQLLNAAPEDVLIAEAGVTAALASVDQARVRRDACDDATLVSVKKEDREDEDPPIRRESQSSCPGGTKQMLDAEVDLARADLVAAEMQFQALTAPAMPQIQYVVTPYEQAVVVASARVQKLRTGGSRDAVTLGRNVRTAQADVERFQAALAGSQVGIIAGWMAGAEAILDEAQYRVAQAARGEGGPDVRAEDIVMAEAEARAAEARFLTVLNPLQETIETARANLERAEANVRAAEGRRRGCGDGEVIGLEKIEGKAGDRRTVTEINCSDNTKESLNWGIEVARLQQGIAFQSLKFLTDPAAPQILNVIAPAQQAAISAAADVQKLKTGGSKDQAALDLDVTLARSYLTLWQSLAGNNPAGLLQAMIGATQAVHTEALARQAQARAGAGGPRERPEDIAIAGASLAARDAELQQFLDPPQEVVESARLAIQVNQATTEQARYVKRACGDLRLTTTFQEGEDKDGDPKEAPLTFKTNLKCSDDQKDALRSLEDGIAGFILVPQALYSLLTDLATNEKLQVLVAGKKAAVAVAQAELEKTKTGGNADEATLDLGVTVGATATQCWQAFAVEASQGGLPQQMTPYAWTLPDPCALSQLPGKLPGFMQQNVMLPATTP